MLLYKRFFTFLIISVQVVNVFTEINNQYMTYFSKEVPIGRSLFTFRRKPIYLESKYSYSVQLVLQKGESPCSLNPNATIPKGPVEFVVKAPQYSYYGIIAIIQSVHLRQNLKMSDDDEDDEQCRDYVQFMTEEESNEILPSTKICGRMTRDVHNPEPPELIGPRIFFNPKGSIKLQVHMDPELNIEDSDDDFNIGAEIVFTAYTACPGTEVGLQTLKPCSSQEPISCIPAPLFCDSKIDCGFDEKFAIDEQYCYFPYIYAGVFVTLVISVVLIIYGFMHWVKIKAKRALAANGGIQYSAQNESTGTGIGGGESMCAAVESVDMDASMAAF